MRDWINRPILVLDYEGKEHLNKVDVSYKDISRNVDEIYIRVRLRNRGRNIARKCIVYLTSLEEVSTSGETPTSFAEAIPLSWPFHEFGPRDIPTGPDFYVDLVRISKHASGWNLCIENDYPNHAPLKTYRGIYRFHLVATSDTAESANFVLDITYEGDWHGLRVHNIGSTIS